MFYGIIPAMLIAPKAHSYAIKERQRIIDAVNRQYPDMRLQDINEVGYRLTSRTPEELLAAGGFLPKEQSVHIASKTGSPNNSGLVDFSLVPEVTTIFTPFRDRGRKRQFIYAAPLDKGYLMPGDWRQVATPGLPMPEFLIAREVLENKHNHMRLGDARLIGHIPARYANDERFQQFMFEKEIEIPQDIGLGDEHSPALYSIRDTAVSSRLFPTNSSHRGF